MFHRYEVEFCESIAGGFAAWVMVPRPEYFRQGAPKVAYLLVQAEDWAMLEKRLRVSLRDLDQSVYQNPLSLRIDLKRAVEPGASLILCNQWREILAQLDAPFIRKPLQGFGETIFLAGAGAAYKLRWVLSAVTVAGIDDSPKPELIHRLLQLLDEETPASVQVNQGGFPSAKGELLHGVFEGIEKAQLL